MSHRHAALRPERRLAEMTPMCVEAARTQSPSAPHETPATVEGWAAAQGLRGQGFPWARRHCAGAPTQALTSAPLPPPPHTAEKCDAHSPAKAGRKPLQASGDPADVCTHAAHTDGLLGVAPAGHSVSPPPGCTRTGKQKTSPSVGLLGVWPVFSAGLKPGSTRSSEGSALRPHA